MFRHLRWQIALAVGGVVLIGALLVLLSGRTFDDRPARGGQLVEALVGQPATFSPLFATEDAENDVVRLVFEGLTRPDAEGRMRPALATRWEIDGDGLTYTFHLREGALWHDGEPVTAQDVVFTADLAGDRDLPGKAPRARPWERARTEALDRHTVRVTLDEPYAPFLEAASLGLLPAHLLAGVPAAELRTHRNSTLEPIGTGPYRLAMPGGLEEASITLTRFDGDGAADDGPPYLDRIVFRLYASEAAALEALGRHEVQAMGGVPGDALGALGEEVRPYSAGQDGYTLIYLNPADVLFTDGAVRRALSLALDREGLVQDPALLNGQAIVAASPIAPGSWAYDPSVQAPVADPPEAARVLDEAGWTDGDGDGIRDRDGKPLAFALSTSNDPLLLAIAERVQHGWAAIGVRVDVETLTQQATVSDLSQRAFEAMLFGWDLREYDPDPYALWHSSQAAEGQNYAGFANPEADRLLVESRRAPPDDLERRAALYGEFQRLFAAEQPALLLYHPVYTYAVVDPTIGGIQLPQLVVEPADRYLTLPDWYVQTERVFAERARPTPPSAR